jgi:hypothetical protein
MQNFVPRRLQPSRHGGRCCHAGRESSLVNSLGAFSWRGCCKDLDLSFFTRPFDLFLIINITLADSTAFHIDFWLISRSHAASFCRCFLNAPWCHGLICGCPVVLFHTVLPWSWGNLKSAMPATVTHWNSVNQGTWSAFKQFSYLNQVVLIRIWLGFWTGRGGSQDKLSPLTEKQNHEAGATSSLLASTGISMQHPGE